MFAIIAQDRMKDSVVRDVTECSIFLTGIHAGVLWMLEGDYCTR